MSGTQTPPPVITFSEIPAAPGFQVPGDYIEVKAGYSLTGILPFPARNLLIGQMTSAGTATPLVIYPNITDPLTARALGGAGSMADRIATAHLLANKGVPVDMIFVADAGGSVKAVWTLAFATTGTGNGTVAVRAAGQRITVGTQAGDTAAATAGAFVAAINAVPTLPFVATLSSANAVLTAKNGGLAANDIQFVINPSPGDALPAGLSLSVTATTAGTTNPSVAGVIAVAQRWYTDVLLPWNDSANLAAASAEAERRYNALVRWDMRWHYGFAGSVSQSLANAALANSRFLYQTPMLAPGSEPYCIAAAVMGVASISLLNDPSQQLIEQAVPAVVGPVFANAWQDEPDRQALLSGGCSVFTVNHMGQVKILRYVSTYTLNANGGLDPAWHDIMEAAVSTRIRYDWRSYRTSVWGGSKLANDGDLAAQLNNGVCTPRRMKASWAARCGTYAAAGWIIDVPAQVARAIFVRDPNDPNRLNEQVYYTRIGNLMIDAGQMIFNVNGE